MLTKVYKCIGYTYLIQAVESYKEEFRLSWDVAPHNWVIGL
jgi:hypothetical protein